LDQFKAAKNTETAQELAETLDHERRVHEEKLAAYQQTLLQQKAAFEAEKAEIKAIHGTELAMKDDEIAA
jgi:hypothetical protein